MDTYYVYVQLDGCGRITAVNSSAFLCDLTGWSLADEGTGDQYHHAQHNYFPLPLMDDNGHYNYKLLGGVPVLRTEQDKATDQEPENVKTTEEKLTELVVEVNEAMFAIMLLSIE